MPEAPEFALNTATTQALEIAYAEYGDAGGWPCLLAHGFPYDIHAFAETAPILAEAGARVIVPYLRGFGPTRFVKSDCLRSGEQAALGHDLISLMDALGIERAVLGGYDWGGRACCVVSALWPERARALVSGNGYNIQDIANSGQPVRPEEEAAYWYQYYFHSERGHAGLKKNRQSLARLLWRLWSPEWEFSKETFERSAGAFDNPDFVDVVIHSYRHRFGLVGGDPNYAQIETRLQAQPKISVPTLAIDGACDGVMGTRPDDRLSFDGPFRAETWPGAGHNLPQERPEEWARAVLLARQLAV